MRFTAYITRRELLSGSRSNHEASIARIAQIFASDIMPEHCRQYSLRCASSGMRHDLSHRGSALPPPEHHLPHLLPKPHPSTSQFTFQGLPAGILESYLLARHGAVTLHDKVSNSSASSSIGVSLPRAVKEQVSQQDAGNDLTQSTVSPGGKSRRPNRRDPSSASEYFKAMTIISSPLQFRDSLVDTSAKIPSSPPYSA